VKKFKFTVHAEFILTEDEVFYPQDLSRNSATARKEFLDFCCNDLEDGLVSWNLRLGPEHLTVEEVMEQAKELVFETGAWKFED